MKYNLTEIQYVQIARERFCKTIGDIPFVSDVEISPKGIQGDFGDFYAIVHFMDQEETICFCIDVKANGEKRFVNQFIRRAEQHKGGIYYVFMAPYISEESAYILREGEYNYVDLSGNCHILTKRIYISISGQENKYIVKREKKNYLSKSSGAASAVIRTMLNAPQKRWKVITLAEESGKAMGTVSNTKSFLRDRDWIREESAGFGLRNIRELLYAWAKDYHKKDARSYEYYSLQTIPELERKIAEWSMGHDNAAVLGGFSAAARYAPTVRYKRIDVYVEPQYFDEFVKDMDLKDVSSGGNILITIPHDETPCMYAKILHDALVTSPAQTVIDLLGNAGRGEEAADAIIMKEYPEDCTNDGR